MKRKEAFTLMELVLVMMISGILIASVLIGKEMTSGAELRGLMRQYEKYTSAINNFDDSYGQYPGDFKRAYDYWADSCDSEAVCNGNGDAKIAAYKESHLVWFHLQKANLIGGGYTGEGDGDDNTQTAGVNVPQGELIPVQLSVVYYEGDEFPANQHYMVMGAAKAEDIGYSVALAPNDAYLIDEKFDDAMPSEGKVLGRNGFKEGNYTNSNCLVDSDNNHVDNDAEILEDIYYNADVDSAECILGLVF